ncbi:MAG: hypothetical protein AAF492_13015, partial [Verrucomicrobiota bacterium]
MVESKTMSRRFPFSIFVLLVSALWFAGLCALSLTGRGLYPVRGIDVYIWVGIPGLIVSLLFLRAAPKPRAGFALSLCTTIFCLYLVEAALLVLPSPHNLHDQYARAAERLGQPFDRRERVEVMKDMQAAGEKTTIAYMPHHRVYIETEAKGETPLIPLGGISKRKTVLSNESGEYIIYMSDRYGFRNPVETSYTNSPDIVLVGDSFAMGC